MNLCNVPSVEWPWEGCGVCLNLRACVLVDINGLNVFFMQFVYNSLFIFIYLNDVEQLPQPCTDALQLRHKSPRDQAWRHKTGRNCTHRWIKITARFKMGLKKIKSSKRTVQHFREDLRGMSSFSRVFVCLGYDEMRVDMMTHAWTAKHVQLVCIFHEWTKQNRQSHLLTGICFDPSWLAAELESYHRI